MTEQLWKADLRRIDGALSEVYRGDRDGAVAHFRNLLAMEKLVGEPIAARLVSPIAGRSIYFSWFDRPLGMSRIHPLAPLDLDAMEDRTREAAKWLPDASMRGPLGELLELLQGIRDREANVHPSLTDGDLADEALIALGKSRDDAARALALLHRMGVL